MAEEPGDLVEHHQPRGIADGDDQRVLLLLDGHKVVAEHQLDGHGAQQVVLNLEVFQINEFGVIALRQRFRLGASRPVDGPPESGTVGELRLS